MFIDITYKFHSSVHTWGSNATKCANNISIKDMFQVYYKVYKAYKVQDLNSKIFQHSMELNHVPNFSSFKVLVSNCKVLSKRLFIESFYAKILCINSKYWINEAADIPSEYVIFT